MIADNEALGPRITISIGDPDDMPQFDDGYVIHATFTTTPLKLEPDEEFLAFLKKLFDV